MQTHLPGSGNKNDMGSTGSEAFSRDYSSLAAGRITICTVDRAVDMAINNRIEHDPEACTAAISTRSGSW